MSQDNSQDLVFWNSVNYLTLTAENILLLPGMVSADDTSPYGYIYSNPQATPKPVSVKNITLTGELLIAGNPDPVFRESNVERQYEQTEYKGGIIYAVNFSGGGALSLTAQSGDARTDVYTWDQWDPLNQIGAFKDSELRISQSATYATPTSMDDSYATKRAHESAAILSKGGTFVINSDFNGIMENEHSVTLTGYYKDTTLTDNSSYTTSTGAFIRADSIDIRNNFLGKVTVSGSFYAKGKKEAKTDGNTITFQGLWAETGDITCGGIFKTQDLDIDPSNNYSISVSANNISIIADTVTLAEPKDGPASADGNVINVYGLRADKGTITVKRDFSAVINSTLDSVTVLAQASGDKQKSTFDVTAGSYGLYSQNLVLGGSYLGNITAKINDLKLTAAGATTKDTSTANITAAAIYAYAIEDEETKKKTGGNITVSSWLSGYLTTLWKETTATSGDIKYGNNDHGKNYCHEAYGIYAGNTLSVGDGRGFIDSVITVEQDDIEIDHNMASLIYGIKADKIYADSLGATITVTAPLGIGISIEKFANNITDLPNVKESSFDIIGDIVVDSLYDGYGIETQSPINLRISSDITATYSILSGKIKYADNDQGYDFTSENFDDNIELAAGSTINGHMLLYGGTNCVSINSNARLDGYILSDGGTLNLTFVLDRYGLMDGTMNRSASNDVIFSGGLTSPVGTTVLIDLNAAEYGTYYLMRKGTGVATASLVYQGTTISIDFKQNPTDEDAVKIGNMSVKGFKDANNLWITVEKAKERTLDDFSAASVRINDNGTGTVTCTLSNTADRDMSQYAGYTLWLFYTDENGDDHAVKNTSPLTSYGSGNVTFTGLGKVSNLNAVLSKDATNENNRAQWKQTLAVTGTTDSETGIFRLSWKLNSSEPVNDTYRYDVEYRISKDGGAHWTNSTLVTMDYLASYYEIAEMKDYYKVQARVRLVDAGSSQNYAIGEWSEIETFDFKTKSAAKIPVVTGLTDNISTGITANAVRRLEWNDMRSQMDDGLKHYEIQYFWAKNNGNPIKDLSDDELAEVWTNYNKTTGKSYFTRDGKTVNVTIYDRVVTTNTYILSNLDVNAAYYWRVRAVSLKDDTQESWSKSERITIVTGDTTPPENDPLGDNIEINANFDYINKTMTISWDGYLAKDDASSKENITYFVKYKDTNRDTDYMTYQAQKITDSGSSYSVTISGYDMKQDFHYKITAKDEAGNESEVLRGGDGEEGLLKGDQTKPSGGLLKVDKITHADNSAGGKDFIVKFLITPAKDTKNADEINSPSGIASTELQYSKDGTSWVTIQKWTSVEDIPASFTAPGIDTRDLPTDEDSKKTTFWRLCATDHAGNEFSTETMEVKSEQTIDFDSESLKSTDPDNPPIILSWDAATTTMYPIYGYTVMAKATDEDDWKVLGNTLAGTTTFTIASDQLDSGTEYSWKVIATDEENNSVEAIAPETLKMPGTPPYQFKNFTVTPTYSGSAMNVTISWTGNSKLSNQTYSIQRSEIGKNDFEEITTVKSSSDAVSTILENVTAPYEYRVETKSAKGDKDITSDAAPALPDTTSPVFASSTKTSYDGFTLTWDGANDPAGEEGEAISGVKEYTLYFDTTEALSGNAIIITTGSSNPYFALTEDLKTTKFQDGKTYYWGIYAKDNAGNESSLFKAGAGATITIDNTAPESPTTQPTWNAPTIRVTSYNYVKPQTDGIYDAPAVRDPAGIEVTFDVSNNTYKDEGSGRTDSSGRYDCFSYEIATDPNFAHIVYSSVNDYYEGKSTTPTPFGHNKLTLSTSNNGITRLAGYKKGQVFYWRVRALNTQGIYADEYVSGTPFTLSDPAIEYEDGTCAPIQDLYTNPTVPGNFNATVNTDSGKVDFTWTSSTDAFGIKQYEIMQTNVKTKKVTYQLVDATLINETIRVTSADAALAAGDYQFKIRAYDGSGKKSDWSKAVSLSVKNSGSGGSSGSAITLSNTAPDYTKAYTVTYKLPGKTLGLSTNENEIWFKIGGATSGADRLLTSGMLNLAVNSTNSKLKFTLYDGALKTKLKTFTVTSAGGLKNFLYNYEQYPNLMYIQVQNLNKKIYDVTLNMTVALDYYPSSKDDLGPNSFQEAEKSGVRYLGATGKTTISEWVGIGDPADYWMLVGGEEEGAKNSGQLNGITVSGVQAKLKVSLYAKEAAGSYKKLATKTISKDATLFAKQMVDKNYYVVVESGDNGAGKQNSSYKLTVNETYYQNNNDSWDNPTAIVVGEKKTNQWVGYGDPQNHYQFTVTEEAGDGVFSVNLRTYSAKVNAALYNVSNGSYTLISKQVSVKGDKTNIFAKSAPVLEAGKTYMVVVDAGNVKKASQNTSFDIQVTETQSFKQKQAKNAYNDISTAFDLNSSSSHNGWVGFNDAENFYKFTYKENSQGKFRPIVKAAKGSKITTVFCDSNKNVVKESQMVSGETYYLQVYTKDPNKNYSNDFTVTMQYK